MSAARVRRIDRIGTLVVVADEAAANGPLAAGLIAVHPTAEGYLRARARIARDGLLEYGDGRSTWNEYRSRDELAKAAPSFALVLVTDDHPTDFVNPDNARELFAGMLGQDTAVEVGDDGVAYLVATITVADAAAIAKVKGGKVQLSIGFSTRIVDSPGVLDGVPFAYLQCDIEGNHTAIVDEGRAGPVVKIPVGDIRAALRDAAVGTRRLDQRGARAPRRDDMETVPVEIQGVTYQVEPAVAAYIAAVQAQLQAAAPPAAEGAGATPVATPPPAAGAAPAVVVPAAAGATLVPGPTVPPRASGDAAGDARVAAAEAARDAAQARADALEAGQAARIDARVELVATARELVGDAITSGMPDHDIHRAVAKAVFPTLAAKLDAIKPAANGKLSEGEAGYLRALYDQAVAHRSSERSDIASTVTRARDHHADAANNLDDIYQAADDLAARREGRTPPVAAAKK